MLGTSPNNIWQSNNTSHAPMYLLPPQWNVSPNALMCLLMSGFRFNGNGWRRWEGELGRGAKNDGWQRVVRVSNVLIFPLTLNLCPG